MNQSNYVNVNETSEASGEVLNFLIYSTLSEHCIYVSVVAMLTLKNNRLIHKNNNIGKKRLHKHVDKQQWKKAA